MKTLQEILESELVQLETGFHVKGGYLNPAMLENLIKRGFQNRKKSNERLDLDPALAALVGHFIDPIWMISMSGLPPKVAHDSIRAYLAGMVMAWERANIAFNDQLKPKP